MTASARPPETWACQHNFQLEQNRGHEASPQWGPFAASFGSSTPVRRARGPTPETDRAHSSPRYQFSPKYRSEPRTNSTICAVVKRAPWFQPKGHPPGTAAAAPAYLVTLVITWMETHAASQHLVPDELVCRSRAPAVLTTQPLPADSSPHGDDVGHRWFGSS